jgi:hypothetical protein
VLAASGFVVEHLGLERHVQEFSSVEEALGAVVGVEDRWRAEGRWSRYIAFLEHGGRTMTRAHIVGKARRQ